MKLAFELQYTIVYIKCHVLHVSEFESGLHLTLRARFIFVSITSELDTFLRLNYRLQKRSASEQ